MKKLRELGFVEIMTDDLNERAWMNIKGRIFRGDKTFIVYRTLGTTIYKVVMTVGVKDTERYFDSEETLIGFLASEMSDEVFYITTGLLVLAFLATLVAFILVNRPPTV
jgi:hypothetical protein